MKTTRRFVFFALTVFTSATLCQAATPVAPLAPRELITKVTHDAIAIMADPGLSKDQKHKQVLQLAYDNLDFETLSKLSLGTYWRTLDAAKRAEFIPEYRQHLSNTYVHMTDEYTDEIVKITEDRKEDDGDHTVITQILGTRDGQQQEVAKVQYRIRKKGDDWKIIDVTVDNVSLASNFRSQFSEIMANGGIDALLKLLRDKNAAAEKQP